MYKSHLQPLLVNQKLTPHFLAVSTPFLVARKAGGGRALQEGFRGALVCQAPHETPLLPHPHSSPRVSQHCYASSRDERTRVQKSQATRPKFQSMLKRAGVGSQDLGCPVQHLLGRLLLWETDILPSTWRRCLTPKPSSSNLQTMPKMEGCAQLGLGAVFKKAGLVCVAACPPFPIGRPAYSLPS